MSTETERQIQSLLAEHIGAWSAQTRDDLTIKLASREAAAQRRGYDDAIQRVRDAHANCVDECDLCIVRDEMLDDLSDPYPVTEEPS